MSHGNGKTTTKEAGAGTAEVPRPADAGKPGTRPAGTVTAPSQSPAGGQLMTSGGRTTIAECVVAKIAGMAAREVGGVHAMGSGMSRTFGSMRERIPGVGGVNVSQGVAVEVGERQTAVDIDLVVDYGVSIPDLTSAVRRNVVNSIEHMCGLEVVEVNISVDDIHLPDDDSNNDKEPAEPRVK